MATRWVESDGVKGSWQGPWRISGPGGQNGVDGDDFEYIYIRTKTDNKNEIIYSCNSIEPASDSLGSSVDKDGFVPVGWKNHPQGIDSNYKYEWMAFRKKMHSKDDMVGSWTTFTGPILWSAYGKQGTDGDGV